MYTECSILFSAHSTLSSLLLTLLSAGDIPGQELNEKYDKGHPFDSVNSVGAVTKVKRS